MRAGGPLAAGLVVAAYAAALRTYGIFDLADEGVLLAQAWRAAHGERPYVDFATGYGPLYFHLQGWLVRVGGLDAVRWALVAVHGATGALVYALTRRLAGWEMAVAAVALEVGFFLALAPRQGAPFNLPYPAWYAGLAGMALAAVLGGRPPGARRALVAGVLAGLAFGVKPNSGLLLAGGAAAAIVLDGPAGRVGRAGAAVLGLLAAGSVVLVAPTGVTTAAWVLVPPVAALAALGTARGAAARDALVRLGALGAGFAAMAVVTYAPSLAALGPERFAREALLVGAGVAGVYALPFPWPAAVAVLVGLVAFVTRSAPRALALAAVVSVGLGLAAGAAGASHVAPALRLGAEQAAFVLVPLTLWGALAVLRRGGEAGSLTAPAAIAVVGALQLYPRPDFVHLMPVASLLLPVALSLWPAVAARLPLPAAAVPALRLGVPLLAAAGRFVPTLVVLVHLATGQLARVAVGGTVLTVEPAGAETLRAVAAAAAAVRSATGPEERVIAFPACALVPFFADRHPAGPHDYFYPGRPERAEVAALAARLAAAPPALAVTCSAEGTEVGDAWRYYPEMVDLLTARYRVLLDRPPFVVRGPGE